MPEYTVEEPAGDIQQAISRREFFKKSAFGAALLATDWRAELSRPALPERKGVSQKVLIIGAGMAGLAAGYELSRAGHDLTILEAQMRPGGRVHTQREPFSDGLYAEAGAMVIPDTHDFTLKYVRLFDLPLNPNLPSDLGSVGYFRGKRIKFTEGVVPEYPFDLTPEEKKAGGLWKQYVLPASKEIGNPAATDWPLASFQKYDRMSWWEFLRAQGASPEALALMTAGFLWGDGADTVSALVVLRDGVHYQNAKNWYTIRGGNDLLPKAFAARLVEKIRYGSPVVKIEHDARGARLTFLQAGERRTATADYVICAIPFSVLRRLEVSPPFSPEKRKAIQELPYFSAARISLQSRNRFWADEGLDGEAWTDFPIMNVHHMTSGQPGPRGILQCYMGGPQARRVTAMKQSERILFTLEHMERVYPGIRENFEGGASQCWHEDEWARGASSWYRPGQMSELWPHIARPEGRVHFAGDHTSPWIRWMQGAIHSGLRVASEVDSAV